VLVHGTDERGALGEVIEAVQVLAVAEERLPFLVDLW